MVEQPNFVCLHETKCIPYFDYIEDEKLCKKKLDCM